MTLAAGLEAMGIGMVIPFVSMLDRPDVVENTHALRVVRDLFGARSQLETVLVFGLALVAVFAIKNVYLSVVQYAQFKFVYQQQIKRSGELLETFMRRPWTFHLQHNSSELIHTINYEVSQVYHHVVISAFVMAVELLSLVVIAVILVALEPVVIPGVAVVLGIVSVLFYRRLQRRAAELSGRLRTEQVEMVKGIQQGLAGVKEATILGCQQYFLDAFRRSGEAYSRSLVVHGVMGALPRYILETVGVLGLVFVTVAMLGRGGSTHSVLPILGALAVASVRMLPSLARILGSVAQIRFHRPSLEALHEAFATDDVEHQREEPAPKLEPLPLENFVAFSNVHYTYPGSARPALCGIDFQIARGESIGLVGLSGGGKTTIADTLIGLLEPDRGSVDVDGEPLRGARLTAWQRNIGYIPQTIFLCDDTIRRNVAFGVVDHEIDEVRLDRALRAARLDEFVAGLPEGLSTFVGERGIRLSGGQRQRIGIARALYFEPKMLVLDEATSSLDGNTEREVVEAIERLRSERTMLVIAHRLSTVRACDRIVVVAAGKVVDSGTWDELLVRSLDFQKLVRAGHMPEKDHGTFEHPPAN